MYVLFGHLVYETLLQTNDNLHKLTNQVPKGPCLTILIFAALRVCPVLGQHPGPARRLLPPEPSRRRGEHILVAGVYKLTNQELLLWVTNLTFS